jgi:hypothetical protein
MKLAMKQSRSIGSLVAGYRLFSILLPSVFVLYFFIWSAKIFFNPPKPAVDRQGLRIINAIEMPKAIFENYPYNSWQNWLFSHSERREGSQLSEKL